MKFDSSLRMRLFMLIMTPLIVIAGILGYWGYTAAVATAQELFDRSLLSTTLAISRDVTISGGDALSVTTRDLMHQAAGGEVFYHVSGPDRAYVTAYAYPPVAPTGSGETIGRPFYFEALYRGELVRAVRLSEQTAIAGLTGVSTVTVWRWGAERRGFARRLAGQSAILLAILVSSMALVVWFGVDRGLKPLLDLRDAIAQRSSDDLSQIRRKVPREVFGIVSTLNQLLDQVRDAFQARDAFISDAAHQLRNPVAGVLALVEATERATSDAERKTRLAELRTAAERAARLTNQLLSFETAKGRAETREFVPLDLNELAERVAARNAARVLTAGIAFDFTRAEGPCQIEGDCLLLEEAVENLIDNALRHGPPRLTRMSIQVRNEATSTILTVSDDGKGLSPDDAEKAFARFGQVHQSDGSGLGLAITAEIARLHGAEVSIDAAQRGAAVSLRFRRGTKHARHAKIRPETYPTAS